MPNARAGFTVAQAMTVSRSLVAEVLEDGQPVPGFERSRCLPIHEDGLDHVVRWQNKESLPSLGSRPIDIRLRLTDAEIFALWSE